MYLSERCGYDCAGQEGTRPTVLKPTCLCTLLPRLVAFHLSLPLVLYNQQQSIPLYRQGKKQQIKACLCVASKSILTSRWRHRPVFVPQGFKEAEMTADVGTPQRRVCPPPCIAVQLTFHLGTLSPAHVMTSDSLGEIIKAVMQEGEKKNKHFMVHTHRDARAGVHNINAPYPHLRAQDMYKS